MSWFFIALWAPFLLACANHNDKFLLSRYLKEKSIGSIVIPFSLFSGVAIPIVLFIHPDAYDVSLVQGSALVATGMSSVFAAVCYLYALDIDEASFVTPFYQTVPIFAYFLGYFILGETITLVQGLGSFVIIVGALALSFEFGRRGIRFKQNVVALMLGASFLSAVNGVIFKLIAVDKGFWVSLFLGFRRPSDGRFDLFGLRSKLPQRFPRPLQATESRRCWPYRVEQDIVQRQRSRHALRDATGARRIGPSREFVPAPFRLYTWYRAHTVSASRGEGIPGPHEDAAKGSGNWPHARRWLLDQQIRLDGLI
jgi:EamA-like transporter family